MVNNTDDDDMTSNVLSQSIHKVENTMSANDSERLHADRLEQSDEENEGYEKGYNILKSFHNW